MKQLYRDWRVFAALMCAAALMACAGLTANTFNDKVAAASITITSSTSAVNTLATAGKITKKQAESALAASKAGSLALDTAQSMKNAGDPQADSQLQLANTILEGLKVFLISQGATVK
jgi:hypothetical protein